MSREGRAGSRVERVDFCSKSAHWILSPIPNPPCSLSPQSYASYEAGMGPRRLIGVQKAYPEVN